MTLKRMFLLSFLISLLVTAVISWPLPKYLFSGIPASATNVEKDGVRRMMEGDHLQMLYNYWIFSDMLLGQTPFWHNIYEFNTGDDAERKYVGPDLLPFSLVFTAGYAIVNRAFAWNLLLFTSLWMSYLMTWILVRRYTGEQIASALGALMILYLPYRWASMLGGSPTGIAMVLTPMLYLGLDLAIRDKRIWGGVLAGLAILFAAWNDAHILFLGLLIAPCFALIAFLYDRHFKWFNWHDWYRMILALIPFALIAGIPIAVSMLAVSGGDIENTTIESGRSMQEVALFSPKPNGLIAWIADGNENSIYIGWLLPALIVAGLFLVIWYFLRTPKTEYNVLLGYLLLLGLSTLIIILALGPYGPHKAHLFLQVRKHLPHYDMIRQPAKIFALLPPLLALLAGISMTKLIEVTRPHRRKITQTVLIVFFAILGITYSMQVRPTVCLVDSEQQAYAAVAEDARTNNNEARVLIIPLWPGDSAWSSLYEHYVSLYRIRMINGYLPVVPNDYVQNIAVFHEFSNVGIIPEKQMQDLQQRGIKYIIFHEDAFPEQVSNFPAGFTLYKLLTHPRLELLKQDANVWAFKILDQERTPAPPEALNEWDTFFPTYNCFWEAEWGEQSEPDLVTTVPEAFGEKAVTLTPEKNLTLFVIPHCGAPQSALLLRAQGDGTLQTRFVLNNGITNTVETPIHTNRWSWYQVSIEPIGDSTTFQPVFSAKDGSIQVDAAMSFAGHIPELEPGQSWTIPAPLLFHAGYTDLESNTINLRPDYQSDGGRWGIFYGPKVPLPPGQYEVTILFDTPAPDGTPMGTFYVQHDGTETQDFPVIAGQPATGTFTNDKAYPVNVPFTYSRNAPMRIYSMRFTRTR